MNLSLSQSEQMNAEAPGSEERTVDNESGFLAAPDVPAEQVSDLSVVPKAILPKRPSIAPLDTLEDLLAHETPQWGQGFAPLRPSFVAPAFKPLQSRLLVCHDLAGGYDEDSFVQGGGYNRAYRMYDWGLIDVFVYFRLSSV